MADFADRIKELRLAKKKTLRGLAEDLFVSYSTIAGWEGRRNTAPQDMVLKLAEYFQVSTDYLLGKTDDPRPFPVEDTRSIEERWNDPRNEFLYAMYGEVQDLTDEQKEEILNFVDYLKSKADKGKK